MANLSENVPLFGRSEAKKRDIFSRRDLISEIGRIAEGQYGLITALDLQRIGCRSNEASRLCQRGFLVRRYKGVYAVGTARLSVRGRLLAAVFACGHPAVVSHRSAAALWRLSDLYEPVNVTRPKGGRSRRAGIRIYQARDFERIEWHYKHRIPVTTVAQTLFDCAAVVGLEDLEDMAAVAQRRRMITADELRAVLVRNAGRPGTTVFRELVEELDLDVLKTRSRMEREVIRLCVTAGIRKPKPGALVEGFEVDLFWDEEKVIVEFNSRGFHSDFAAIERDYRRDARHHWHGYKVFRLSYRMLKREPEKVVAHIRRLLSAPPGIVPRSGPSETKKRDNF